VPMVILPTRVREPSQSPRSKVPAA
jgi:hypothetical protein